MKSRNSPLQSTLRSLVLACLPMLSSQLPAQAQTPVPSAINPPPSTRDWAALAQLPDLSGVWTPNISDQNAQIKSNPPPWRSEAQQVIDRLVAQELAGRPKGLWVDCLPLGMPGWMLKSHNALEILSTAGRITLLGEVDGNRLRRIYTDGRGHPEDPDPSFHGHSIGRWEGDTLVVDTVAVLPQTYLAVSEAVGLPNGGELRVTERWRLVDKDVLHDTLEIHAPKVLTKPWTTTRIWFRQRARKYDIAEGVCLQGYHREALDADGYPGFQPIPQTALGNPVPLPK